MMCGVPSRRSAILKQQDGVAMLTVLMLTIILTVIGLAAITTTMMEMKMSGAERLREAAAAAAESCVSSGVQIIQQTWANSALPNTLIGAGNNPFIVATVADLGVSAGQNPLEAEIKKQSIQNLDSADPSVAGNFPNAVFTIAHPSSIFTVNMDIDFLFPRVRPGGPGGEFGGTSLNTENLYRIDCFARAASGTGTVSAHVSTVYACALATGGMSCQLHP